MFRDSRATCIHQRTSTSVYSLTPCVSRACFPRVSRNAFPLSSLGGVTGYAIVCSTSPSPRKIAVHGLRGFLSISAPDCAVKGLMAADIAYLLCGLRKRTKERAARPFERGRSMLGRVQPVPPTSNMGNLHARPFLDRLLSVANRNFVLGRLETRAPYGNKYYQ